GGRREQRQNPQGLGSLIWLWSLERGMWTILSSPIWQRASQRADLASASETAGQRVFIVTACGMLGSWRRERGVESDWWGRVAGARRGPARLAATSSLIARVTACHVS